MNLTSVDYAKLIAWLAFYKHRITLGKTQVQKILFICYGWFMSTHDSLLFTDDAPQAWPFGPVFPRSYRQYYQYYDKELTKEEMNAFSEDSDTLRMITAITDKFCYKTARELTAWSHQADTPWAKAVIQNGKVCWSAPLDLDYTREYFKSGAWRKGLN